MNPISTKILTASGEKVCTEKTYYPYPRSAGITYAVGAPLAAEIKKDE
jgi:hypothetical protein